MGFHHIGKNFGGVQRNIGNWTQKYARDSLCSNLWLRSHKNEVRSAFWPLAQLWSAPFSICSSHKYNIPKSSRWQKWVVLYQRGPRPWKIGLSPPSACSRGILRISSITYHISINHGLNFSPSLQKIRTGWLQPDRWNRRHICFFRPVSPSQQKSRMQISTW